MGIRGGGVQGRVREGARGLGGYVIDKQKYFFL
jgi:hypothetical protein